MATEFTYDSASRLLTDTTAGRTIRYAHDDVDNPTQLTYPSGVEIDQLDRPEAIGQQIGPDELREAVRYRYRGPFLQKRKTLGNGVDLVREFDPARRRVREVGTNPSGSRVFDERLTWSRRNLKTSALRGDLTRSAQVFGYDGAQRVDTTARVLLPEAQEPTIPANRRIPPEVLDKAPEQFRHVYDPAQNLVATVAVSEGIATGATMPPEGSGRNRPASVGGVDLAYDANGNLTGRGGETLSYDFRNRLTRVERADGSLVATYAYDAFNRRVERQVGSTTEATVWNGWQAIGDYADGALSQRRVFGRGLDEIVLTQADVDGDGTLETEYSPLYDETGNVVALTGSGGRVFERHDYSPFGLQRTRVDATPPAMGQVLLRDGRLRLEFDEPIQSDELRDAVGDGRLQLEQIFGDGTSEPVPVVIEQEVDFEIPPLELPEGLQAAAGEAEASVRPGLAELVGNTVGARSTAPLDSDQGIHFRRVFLRPTQPLEEGSQVRLTVAAGAIQDRFQNQASQGIDETFSWTSTGTQVVDDQAPPEVRAVRLRGNRLEIEFSEEPDLATLSAIELGPATAGTEPLELGTSEQPTWQLQDDSVKVVTEEPLPAGERELTIRPDLADLFGETLPESFGLLTSVPATLADVGLFDTEDAGVVDSSTVGNRYGFHGRPVDPETGLMYFRNRYYDPELGRFISADPLGYVDGPSMYGFAGYSPLNFSDPLGLATYFFDGTFNCMNLKWNSPSNVEKLYEAALSGGERAFYVPGIGCEATGRNSYQAATGAGGGKRLEEMYRHLVNAFQAGDSEINIIGFSRGAALARAFANLVRQRGVPTGRMAPVIVPRRGLGMGPEYNKDVKINFLGLFDTVASFSMGEAASIRKIVSGDFLAVPKSVRTVRHAVARDEERHFFPLSSIRSGPSTALPVGWTEVVFPGVHSDVGGGYGATDHASRVPLLWMWRNARAAGSLLGPLHPSDLQLPYDQEKFLHDSRWPFDFYVQGLTEAFTGKVKRREVLYH